MKTILDEMTIEVLEGEELAKIRKHFSCYKTGAVRIFPQHCFMPKPYLNGAQIVYEIEPREQDVYIMTYPKCGTTWVQEIVWTMRNSPNLDHPHASLGIFARCPFIESDYLGEFEDWLPFLKPDCTLVKEFLQMCPNGNYKKPMSIQLANSAPNPRTLKSHMPLSLLNPDILKKSKVVYVLRNPKDACISYYHHNRLFAEVGYKGTMEEFVNLFVSGNIMYGAYDKHVEEIWKLRDSEHLHIVFFEDLKKHTERELRRLDTFLGTQLNDDQIQNVLHYTSFQEMKKRDSAFVSNDLTSNLQFFVKEVVEKDGGFYRKGEIGDYKNRLTPELESIMDNWIEDSFTKIGIQFDYEK